MLRISLRRVAGVVDPYELYTQLVIVHTRPFGAPAPSETWSSHSLEAHRDTPCFFISPPRFIAHRARFGGSPPFLERAKAESHCGEYYIMLRIRHTRHGLNPYRRATLSVLGEGQMCSKQPSYTIRSAATRNSSFRIPNSALTIAHC